MKEDKRIVVFFKTAIKITCCVYFILLVLGPCNSIFNSVSYDDREMGGLRIRNDSHKRLEYIEVCEKLQSKVLKKHIYGKRRSNSPFFFLKIKNRPPSDIIYIQSNNKNLAILKFDNEMREYSYRPYEIIIPEEKYWPKGSEVINGKR